MQDEVERPIPKLREARLEAKMTQIELAEKAGVTRRTISNLESGKTLPNLSLLFVLAAILGVAWFALYTGRKEDELGGQAE
ncbi:helix-turn-helix transcriptional regulator [Alicyclobacillus sp. ALC3]|uniref:helix-turn-helix transcriptional regulator n=1 Tax=Alicyclobacillus sp. ALC3 TaxID=2796143 RepID=UPI00237987CA|nr:helix-turn-helix transcriptional regulator [Alicyclobacillus sp. ALC3]WDL99180.1 helix-turn-helix transcriptional regulator [Alicyclobacillus sp. ALC3]